MWNPCKVSVNCNTVGKEIQLAACSQNATYAKKNASSCLSHDQERHHIKINKGCQDINQNLLDFDFNMLNVCSSSSRVSVSYSPKEISTLKKKSIWLWKNSFVFFLLPSNKQGSLSHCSASACCKKGQRLFNHHTGFFFLKCLYRHADDKQHTKYVAVSKKAESEWNSLFKYKEV